MHRVLLFYIIERALSQQHPFRLKLLTVLSPHKNVYLLLVHSTTSLSRHDKTCFTRLRFEWYLCQQGIWWEKSLSKTSFIKHLCSWRGKTIVLVLPLWNLTQRKNQQSCGISPCYLEKMRLENDKNEWRIQKLCDFSRCVVYFLW